ncbi:serine/threonine-protein kinase pakA isoform X2 [Pieris rapae]|uniref:serine/threonine-protein kinase pakA isoform X2 n=1 Tax=Pieris rapae TaxID=64459 RepID=UPI001E27D204|nr:serine/threonine-protein kinase pakA isoform X2 [Pieris rapae]
MISIWVVTTVVLAMAGTISEGYDYNVPNPLFGASSAQGSTSTGYAYRPGSNYKASSNLGYSSTFGNYGNHGASTGIGSGLSSTGHPTGSYVQSSSSFGTDSNKKYLSGTGSSYNSGYYQTGSGSTTGSGSGYYQTGSGSTTGSGSNYNVVGSSQSNHNSGSAFGTGSNNNYGTTGSFGSNNYGTGSGHQLTEYQTTFESTSDTSGLDKIGSHYESASAANQFQSSNQYHSAAKQEYYIQNSQQPTQVFKHFYVLSAPEEPEPVRQRQPIVLPPTQKHYKIIFIKAPSQPAPSPQIITVPQQNEEKTIVYVLVKKPEDVKNIALPKFESKAPTKPEVFFIKYNDKSDSQALIDNIVNDYNKGGVKASFSNLNIGSSKGSTVTATGPTLTSEETSGSLDSILNSEQSFMVGGSDSSSQFNEGTSLLSNKDASNIKTGSGTNLQSTSNYATGSIYVPFQENKHSSSYNSYDSAIKQETGNFPSVNNDVSSSTSESAVENIDNRFNTDIAASTINQGTGETFAAVVNDESSSVSSIISNSNLDSSFGSSGLDTTLPSNLYGSSTVKDSSNGLGSSTATSFGTALDYNSGTSYNSYNTAKPSVSFGTHYNNLDSSSGSSAVGSETYSSSSGFGSGVSSVNTHHQNSLPYNSFGSTTPNVLPSGAQSSYDSSLVSPSQGVPHETYGPPKFKVF